MPELRGEEAEERGAEQLPAHGGGHEEQQHDAQPGKRPVRALDVRSHLRLGLRRPDDSRDPRDVPDKPDDVYGEVGGHRE